MTSVKRQAHGRLLAPRFVEAGVRFVEISYPDWDQHTDLRSKHTANCLATDQPIAVLIADLDRRELLDETLLLWGAEFGRTPGTTNHRSVNDGRDPNAQGFTMWMAGGGGKGGLRYGATDEHGFEAVEGKVHIHDLHATTLHLMDLDHEKLTYRYSGRDFRLTDVHGRVLKEIIAYLQHNPHRITSAQTLPITVPIHTNCSLHNNPGISLFRTAT